MNNKEMLSVFMDGELDDSDAGSVITQIRKNDELRSCWEHYHLIGDCIRKQLSNAFHSGFADRFSALLDNEPHHFSRAPGTTQNPSPRRFSDKAGFALAASISAVAMLGMLQVNQQNLLTTNETTPVVAYETDIQHQGLAMDTSADTLLPQGADEVQGMSVETPPLAYASFDSVDETGYSADLATDPSVEDSVYDYLVNYSQYAVSAPLQGTSPATVISYYSNL